ncbi:hypothetical protein ACWGIB_03480 [Streptomyces xiamenensis]
MVTTAAARAGSGHRHRATGAARVGRAARPTGARGHRPGCRVAVERRTRRDAG